MEDSHRRRREKDLTRTVRFATHVAGILLLRRCQKALVMSAMKLGMRKIEVVMEMSRLAKNGSAEVHRLGFRGAKFPAN